MGDFFQCFFFFFTWSHGFSAEGSFLFFIFSYSRKTLSLHHIKTAMNELLCHCPSGYTTSHWLLGSMYQWSSIIQSLLTSRKDRNSSINIPHANGSAFTVWRGLSRTCSNFNFVFKPLPISLLNILGLLWVWHSTLQAQAGGAQGETFLILYYASPTLCLWGNAFHSINSPKSESTVILDTSLSSTDTDR